MTAATAPPRRAWTAQIMGMPISLHLRGPGLTSAGVEARVGKVFASLRDADSTFSTYRADSQLSRWERGELPLDSVLAEVIALCEEARTQTGGYFDARALPDPLGNGLRFDPSGLVKGWAVQRAAQHLAGLEDTGWCLNAGGDVLMHTPAGHPPWRVGIEDPGDRSQMAHILAVYTGAVATSGTARRGEHLIDPHTRLPPAAAGSVTVIGPSILWADVYATAAAARGHGAEDWLRSLEDYEWLIIDTSSSSPLSASRNPCGVRQSAHARPGGQPARVHRAALQ